jgi:hypothetical protein
MRRAVASIITCLMALLAIGAPFIASTALVLFLAISFAADAIDTRTPRGARTASAGGFGARGVGPVAVAVVLATQRFSVTWLVAVGGGLACLALGGRWPRQGFTAPRTWPHAR